MMESGAQCVMMGGTSMMVMLCADNLDLEMPSEYTLVLTLVLDPEVSGWMMWLVQEVKVEYQIVRTMDGEWRIVAMQKMQE